MRTLAARETVDEVRVFRRHRRGRDLRLLVVIAQRARMRRAQRRRGDRTDHRCHRTVLRRPARARPAEHHRLSIRLERAAAFHERHVHGLVVEDDLAADLLPPELFELLVRRHLDHVGRNAVRGSRDAAAEGGQYDVLIAMRDQTAALRAAHPARHHHLLLPHVDAPGTELLRGPLHRALRIGRPGQARTDLVGQIRGVIERLAVRKDVIDQRFRGRLCAHDRRA
jgi:hypothetical protein